MPQNTHGEMLSGNLQQRSMFGCQISQSELLSGRKRHEGQRCRDLPKSIFIKLLWVAQALTHTLTHLHTIS